MKSSKSKLIGGKEYDEQEALFRLAAIVESADDAISSATPDGIVLSWNKGAERVYGYSAEEMIGKPTSILAPPDYQDIPQLINEIKRGGTIKNWETVRIRKDGSLVDVAVTVSPVKDASGNIIASSTIARDITEAKRLRETLARQAQEILEVSTPVLQVFEGVVVAPLIGTLDSQRTQRFMERLLERIVETNSPVALVDITGVPTIDTQTAQHLIDTISAVKLLGARVILTGVRPAIAQTLVHLGIDLTGITTRSSLASGLLVAMDSLGLRLVAGNKSEVEGD